MKKIIFLAVFWLTQAGWAGAEAPLKVVATSALNKSLAEHIGGERVTVKHVAPPRFNIHFVQPRPSDVKNVRQADLYIQTSADLEGWSVPLLEAAGKTALFPGGERHVDLSEGVELKDHGHELSRAEGDIHAHGNPHIYLNPEIMKTMAKTLAEKLRSVDAAHAGHYEKNLRAFLGRLDSKISEWKALCANCAGKEIIPYHEDTDYLADFLGIKAERFLESKPGIPPTPRHLESLVKYAKENGVNTVSLASYYPKDIAESFARAVGGKSVIVIQNAGEVPGTEDVFAFYEFNIKQLAEALS